MTPEAPSWTCGGNSLLEGDPGDLLDQLDLHSDFHFAGFVFSNVNFTFNQAEKQLLQFLVTVSLLF